MGGSQSMPGGTTTSTNQLMPWSQYVPQATSGAYNNLTSYLQSQVGEGLTPQEKSYYTGEAMSDVANQYAGAGKSLSESMSRSGVLPGSGANVEAMSDLKRSQAQAGAKALQGVEGMDVQQKQTNVQNMMADIGIPGSPISTGTTTKYAPAGGGGGS